MSHTGKVLLTKNVTGLTEDFSFGVRNLTNEQSTGIIVDWIVIGTAK
jgi:hypothetical protein